MNKKVLLVGAGGQLGSLVNSCVPEGFSIFSFTSKELDICNETEVVKKVQEIQPDYLINAAAYTAVDKAESEKEKAYLINGLAPELLARATSEKTKIIHISTDFVFNGKSDTPYLPSDQVDPVSVYGASKLDGENRLLAICKERVAIIRTAWVYSTEGNNFMNTMLKLMASKESLSIVGDQVGTPTSAHILADVIWRFIVADVPSGIFHWTDQGETSWFGFAQKIQHLGLEFGLLNKEIPITSITTKEYPTPANRPAYSVLDKSSTYDVLGFCGRSWEDELQAVIELKAGSHKN